MKRLPVSVIAATGTRDASTVLHGDGTWQPSGGSSSAGGLNWFDVKAGYGAVGDGTTDDTAAIQAAIDAAVAAGGGTVYFPRGVYLVSGAQVSGSSNGHTYSGQLVLPARNFASPPVTIRFKGETPPPMAVWGGPAHLSGSIVRSTATSGALMDVRSGISAGTSNIEVALEDITFRMPNAPAATCLELQYAGSLTTNGLSVDVNVTSAVDTATASQPPAGSIGLDAPRIGNAAHVSIKNTQVIGYGVGLRHSEHTTLDNFIAEYNLVAIKPDNASQPSHSCIYTRVLLQCNTRGIVPTSNAHIYGVINIEAHADGTWYSTTYDIDDPNNYLDGRLEFHKTISGTGAYPHALLLNGATNILIRDLTRETASVIGKLDDLSDVTVTGTPTDGQVLKYDAATGQWKPATPTVTTSAGSGELLMQDGVTGPPVPLENEARSDWLYQG